MKAKKKIKLKNSSLVLFNMIQREGKLTEDELTKVAHIDVSIQHWAAQHTSMCLQAKRMLDNIITLEQARNQTLDRALKEADIDPRTVQKVSVDEKGVVHCLCSEPSPETNGVVSIEGAKTEAPIPS